MFIRKYMVSSKEWLNPFFLKRIKNFLSAWITIIYLTACSLQPSLESNFFTAYPLCSMTSFQLQGQMVIQTPSQRLSTSFFWIQDHNKYQLQLFGPLGVGTILIQGTPSMIQLQTTHQEIIRSNSPEQLIQSQLGWTLPVSDLYYWIRGLKTSGKSVVQTVDRTDRVKKLQQKGWNIDYLDYMLLPEQKCILPGKIHMQHARLDIRLIIAKWHL